MAEPDQPTAMPELVAAWPPLRRAAVMIGVATSSLSRRTDLVCERRGREERVRPAEVLRLARYYNRRSISVVASELLDFAYEQAPAFAPVIDLEIELTLGPATPSLEPEHFLNAARQGLPEALFAQIERIYRQSLANPAPLPPSLISESDLSTREILRTGTLHLDSSAPLTAPDLRRETSDG